MTQTAHPYGIVVAEGSWLYDGSVPTKVRVCSAKSRSRQGTTMTSPKMRRGVPVRIPRPRLLCSVGIRWRRSRRVAYGAVSDTG